MKYLIPLVFILVACAQGELPAEHNADPMPCHQMPDGTLMGDCAEGETMDHAGHMMDPVTSEEQFIVEMIPHHQEAVDTSQVILAHSANVQMQDLTQRIITAQVQEIAMMRGWLAEWYDNGYEPAYMNMMPALEPYEGFTTDIAYLEGMIAHHEMAVVMAKEVLALEPRAEVAQFAEAVIDVQSAEIAEMREMVNMLRLLDSRAAPN